MWKLLPWTGRGASGYPQRECFFCCTTSIILPPYKQPGASGDDPSTAHQTLNVATSSSTSTISTGTPTNWYCSSCHCQNVAEQDGTPAEQYTRPMWDEAWNRDRSQLMRHTRPQASKSAKASVVSSPQTGTAGRAPFKFCHTCQTNQVLTLNMLADYLPGEDDPEYQQKLHSLPEYEASIASRYPPVCSDCAPVVEERIAERDQFARSWSLGKWLDLKKRASNIDLADSTDRPSSSLAVEPERADSSAIASPTSRSTIGTSIKASLSSITSLDNGSVPAKVMFVLVNMSIWAAYSAIALRPHDMIATAQEVVGRIRGKPISLLTAELVLVILLILPSLLIKCSRMDPLKRSIECARARQLRVEVKGLHLWRNTQSVVLALRFGFLLVTIVAAFRPNDSSQVMDWMASLTGRRRLELLQLAATSLLMSEIGLTASAAFQLGVQSPTPLQLVSRPITAMGGQAKRSNEGSDALLTSLSLDDRAARPTFAFEQGRSDLDSPAEESHSTPRLERDADGDAVMEDAATYVARRASYHSEDEWEDGAARIPAPPASTWSRNWSANGVSKPSFASTHAPRGAAAGTGQPQRSSTYNDFQLGPQRFWEPQNPTGLEDVFGRAVSLDDTPQRNDGNGDQSSKWSKWLGFS
ncbi:uncharacterized protein SRS1_12078 [Sporisorium reilianum f. sp. reilianum]|uniref:Ima1 N-terminal domain-containing protein n=1 Tax=Sporisorium reilianum f. sp. reilianum TaxID=72559 RepID=A0A2N8U820_9BASI|nr:uncharacterized protein SRS1_12078 [Sporisorium reilianum f. sp. reilianum]